MSNTTRRDQVQDPVDILMKGHSSVLARKNAVSLASASTRPAPVQNYVVTEQQSFQEFMKSSSNRAVFSGANKPMPELDDLEPSNLRSESSSSFTSASSRRGSLPSLSVSPSPMLKEFRRQHVLHQNTEIEPTPTRSGKGRERLGLNLNSANSMRSRRSHEASVVLMPFVSRSSGVLSRVAPQGSSEDLEFNFFPVTRSYSVCTPSTSIRHDSMAPSLGHSNRHSSLESSPSDHQSVARSKNVGPKSILEQEITTPRVAQRSPFQEMVSLRRSTIADGMSLPSSMGRQSDELNGQRSRRVSEDIQIKNNHFDAMPSSAASVSQQSRSSGASRGSSRTEGCAILTQLQDKLSRSLSSSQRAPHKMQLDEVEDTLAGIRTKDTKGALFTGLHSRASFRVHK